MNQSSSVAIVVLLAIAAVACDQRSTGEASRHTAIQPVRPVDRTDASASPPPDLNALQAQAASQGTLPTATGPAAAEQTPTRSSPDAYHAAQDAYKSALQKAKADYKAELAKCDALEKTVQVNCREYADSRLRVAKTEAEKLKPAS